MARDKQISSAKYTHRDFAIAIYHGELYSRCDDGLVPRSDNDGAVLRTIDGQRSRRFSPFQSQIINLQSLAPAIVIVAIHTPNVESYGLGAD